MGGINMSQFNSVEYLNDQVDKQYNNTVESIHKNTLNFQPFNQALANFSEEKFWKMKSLVNNESIEKIQNAIKNNYFSYVDLVLYYLKKIRDEDDQYNSVLFLNPKVLSEAKEKKYDDGNHLVYGMPILVKGNIGVKGLPLSAGAAVLKRNIALRDSELIGNLKEKGAIILGQTNLSEFANYMTSNSSNGYSAIGGQTKNPFGLFDVGGSSAGSAVAMAKGFAAGTIGTETAGSIIYPSNQNGIIGLKPTLGSVSQDLIVPISKTHDIAGPMTNNVKDQWILLDAITNRKLKKPNFDSDDLTGVRIGIIKNKEVIDTYRASDQYILEKVKNQLAEKGAILKEVELDNKLFSFDISDVLAYEFKEELNKFLLKDFRNKSINSLEKIIESNLKDLKNNTPYGQDLLEASQNNNYEPGAIKKDIKNYQEESSMIFVDVFRSYDLLLTISNYMTTPYACSGNPAINFPVGKRETGEPVGATLIAEKYKEDKLIQTIHAYFC